MRAAGIGGDVAADCASGLAGGIGRVEKAAGFNRVRNMCIDATGFDESATIAVIDRDDAVHAAKADHDTAGDRKNGAAEAGACASRNDGEIMFGAEFDDGGDFLGVFGKNDRVRLHFFQRVGVAFVNDEFGWIGEEAIGADDRAERIDEGNRER